MHIKIVRTEDKFEELVNHYHISCCGLQLAKVTLDGWEKEIKLTLFPFYAKEENYEPKQVLRIKINNENHFNRYNDFYDFCEYIMVTKVIKEYLYSPNSNNGKEPDDEFITFGFLDNEGKPRNFIEIEEYEDLYDPNVLDVNIRLSDFKYYNFTIDEENTTQNVLFKNVSSYEIPINQDDEK